MLFLALPNAVNALALGSLVVDSGLNQKLKARIELVSMQIDELVDARATLTTQGAFDRAGLRPFILTSLRLEIVTKGTSNYILRPTATDLDLY